MRKRWAQRREDIASAGQFLKQALKWQQYLKSDPRTAADRVGARDVVLSNLEDAAAHLDGLPELQRPILEVLADEDPARAAALQERRKEAAKRREDENTRFDVGLGRRVPKTKSDKRRRRPDGIGFNSPTGARGIDLRPRPAAPSPRRGTQGVTSSPSGRGAPPITDAGPIRTASDVAAGGEFPCAAPGCAAFVELRASERRPGETVTCPAHAGYSEPIRGNRLNPATMGIVGDPALEAIEAELAGLDQTRAELVRRKKELADGT